MAAQTCHTEARLLTKGNRRAFSGDIKWSALAADGFTVHQDQPHMCRDEDEDEDEELHKPSIIHQAK